MRTTSAWLRRKRRRALSAAWRSSEAAEGSFPASSSRAIVGEAPRKARSDRTSESRPSSAVALAPMSSANARRASSSAPWRATWIPHRPARLTAATAASAIPVSQPGVARRGFISTGQRPSRSSQIPLLQERVARQGTDRPSHGASIGAPPVVVPHDAPDTTLPSQKHGSLMVAPTMHTRGEHVRAPESELPLPSLFAP